MQMQRAPHQQKTNGMAGCRKSSIALAQWGSFQSFEKKEK
jgi:hypothetical protein